MPRRKRGNIAFPISPDIYDIIDGGLGTNTVLDSNGTVYSYGVSPPYSASPSAKRRLRRKANKARRQESLEISSGGPSLRTPPDRTPTEPRPDEPQKSPALDGRVLAAIEQVWDLERNIDTTQNLSIDGHPPPLFVTPNPSDLGQIADHASLMPEALSRVKPIDDRHLTVVQKGLITSALKSVIAIMQQIRVITVSLNQELEPLPAMHDDALSVYSGCVVCFARLADMLLMPCRHLTLCEVCCSKIRESEPPAEPMRCPVCRCDVLDRITIYRS